MTMTAGERISTIILIVSIVAGGAYGGTFDMKPDLTTVNAGFSVYESDWGKIEFGFSEELKPVDCFLYDSAGLELSHWSFDYVINLKQSQNRRYMGFFDGSGITFIDLKREQIHSIVGGPYFEIDNQGQVTVDEMEPVIPVEKSGDGTDTHEEIHSPINYYETSFPSIARNGYAQVQEWAHVYLHPGVDLFSPAGTEVCAVADGVVRAILTTGDDQYWRIAIERFDVQGEGYLYAHLNPASFVFEIGDTVSAGDLIGTLYPAWGFSPHCHFVRITPNEPGQWNGVWWTVDNPLVDIINMTDSYPPVFENSIDNDLFAFRTPAGEYLDPLDLQGEIDIISKVVDYAYDVSFDSRIVPYDLKFQLYSGQNPDSVVYEQYSFALDFPLDTYFDLYYYELVLNTIYSRDAVCFSTNNNSNRDFYFVLTNSDGDSTITESDSSEVFDSHLLPNGYYLLEVTARDCGVNESTASMVIYIDNIVPVTPDPERGETTEMISVFPNPANPRTVISYELQVASFTRLTVFDVQGRKVATLVEGYRSAGIQRISFDGSDLASGLYIYHIRAGDFEASDKVLLLK